MIVISISELNEEKINLINKHNKIVELRLDLIFEHFFKKSPSPHDLKISTCLFSLISKINVPKIVTLRKKNAGGAFNGSEKARISLLKEFLKLNIHYIDIEHDSDESFFLWVKEHYPNIKIICSYHNTKKTPGDLHSVFQAMQKRKPDIYKIATFAKRSTDSLRMLSFVREKTGQGYKICGIGMGEKGRITRILSPIFKGYFSFARLDKNTAEGQFDADTLEKRYGYNFLNENTSIFALIGEDVSKSYSHRVYNKIFSIGNFKNIYVKIPLQKKEITLFFNLIKNMPFKGLSITTPYKEYCAHILSLEGDAKAILAINTAFLFKGKLTGYNTDGKGTLDRLEQNCPIQGKKIVVIGAGGSARSICFEAQKRGARVSVLGRTESKALKIAKEMKVQGDSLDNLLDICNKGYDIIINATSSLDPISEEFLLPKTIALDMNANPQWTPFLLKAKNKDCHLIFGFEVFISQGRKQFDLWFKSTT